MSLIVADEPTAGGALKVRVQGAQIVKDSISVAPLVVTTDRPSYCFLGYIRKHLELIPERYRAALRQDLAEVGQACTCTLTPNG